MKMRALALGAVLGFVIAIVPSCGNNTCGPQNCDGCCDGKTCVKKPANNNNNTCGSAGNACVNCAAIQSTCNPTTSTCSGTGTTGGGTGTGGGSGGGTTTGGGSGGGGGTTCDGCKLPSGTCVPASNSAGNSNNCGLGGSLCVTCGNDQLCTNGLCTTPDAGMGVQVGSACTTDTDCEAIPLTANERSNRIRGFCKKTSLSVGVDPYTYQGGYCTKRCLGTPSCNTDGGADNKCGFFMGFIGELENICFDGCTANSDCRSGYACVNFGSTARPYAMCYPLLTDGGLPDDPDAGPKGTASAGGPCADDTACQPPETGACILSDAGFPDGMCISDCSITTSDDFCGPNGFCDPQLLNDPRDTRGPFIYWSCFQGCSADAGTRQNDGGYWPACRTGYSCSEGNFGDVCLP